MAPWQRIEAVLSRRKPDRTPISFWHHFSPDEYSGPRAVQAHLDHLRRYDLDFLKVMNDNGYPHQTHVETLSDLPSIELLKDDEPQFALQLDLLSDLRRAIGPDVLMISTIFNSFAVLRHMIRPPTQHNPPDLSGAVDPPSQQIKGILTEDWEAVKSALDTIGASLANFARRCLGAGADGIYLSVRDDWVQSREEIGLYRRLVMDSDLAVLNAASSARFNLLHVCGHPIDFRSFAEYPVHAVNWADRAAGPAIRDVKDWLKPAICAGIDNLNTLPNGTTGECEREVADALAQADDRPIILSPGCTYDPNKVPTQNLQAICRAARAKRPNARD